MSIAAAVEKILATIDDRVESARPYRAIVSGVGSGLVSIRRPEATTAGTAAYARIVGFPVAVNDEVLCIDVGRYPVIIGRIQRAAAATYSLDAELTVLDSLFTVQDNGDATKQARFQASGITTGTTRTYTLPNASGGLTMINTGYQTPPGPVILNATNVTALATQQCGARYLGMVPFDVSSVEVNVAVTTAAVTITWAEVALASANSAIGGNLTLLGSATNVAATFNSTGVKTVTFSISVTAGTFLYFLFGSQATTPFQLRATLADELSTGVHRLASTTRPSTMAAPTSFATSSAITGAAWCPFRWS